MIKDKTQIKLCKNGLLSSACDSKDASWFIFLRLQRHPVVRAEMIHINQAWVKKGNKLLFS